MTGTVTLGLLLLKFSIKYSISKYHLLQEISGLQAELGPPWPPTVSWFSPSEAPHTIL